MKRDEWSEWSEYYIRIGQFERWSSLKWQTESLIRDMEFKAKAASNDELSRLQDVLAEAKRLCELVHRNAETYCAEKPSKPQGREYYVR